MQHKASLLYILGVLVFNPVFPLYAESKPQCQVGVLESCPDSTVCAKVDASRTECIELLAEPNLVFELPFESSHGVVCTQSGQNPTGSHGFATTLFGLDLATPYEKPAATILAAADGKAFIYDQCQTPPGKAEKAETDDCGLGWGNHVRILHRDGLVSFYVHLDKIQVKQGEHVKQGQPIGVEGWTGLAGYRHLHWQVHKLYGSSAADWEAILAKPGWGGRSVPFYFRILQNGEAQILTSKSVSCIHGDISQPLWWSVP